MKRLVRSSVALVVTCAALSAQGTTAPRERNVALIIGNDQYRYVEHLRTAVNDARALKVILSDHYGFDVRLLIDATRAQIMAELTRYRRTLDANSSLLIYYAGHGYSDPAADNKAYWWPVDAKKDDVSEWISADDITTAIKAMPARHVLIVSDSCFSGTLTRGVTIPNTLPPGSDRIRMLLKLRERPSRELIASGGNEPVADGGAGDHSVFAGALLKALERMEPSEFAVEEIFPEIRESVAGRSDQLPQLDPIRNSGHDGGSFVFSRSASSAGTSPALEGTMPRVAPDNTPIPPPAPNRTPLWSVSSQVLTLPGRDKIYIADASDEKHGAIIVSDPRNTRGAVMSGVRIPIGSTGYEGTVGRPLSMVLDPNAVNPGTKRPFLYVADGRQGKVHVVDIDRNVVLGNGFPVGSSPTSLAIAPDGRKLFVSNEQPAPSGTITVIDISGLTVDEPNNFKILREIRGVGCPEGLAIAPGGKELYAASQCGGGRDPVFVIDTEQDTVIDSIPDLAVGKNLAVSPDGKTLFVARANYPCIQPGGQPGSPFSVLNIESRMIERSVCLRVGVEFVALSRDGVYLFVSNGQNLTVFDAHRVAKDGYGARLNDMTLESSVAGIGVADDNSVYAWILNTPPATPRLFSYNPSGLVRQSPPRK